MNEVTLAAPMAGWLTNIRDVPDPVFAEEMMGVGVAIDPIEGRVVAPCAAQVLLVAPTAHSVTLRTDAGAELLIHVGLETVALRGRGFQARVRDGDRVEAGDLLITFDLDAVGLQAKSLVSPIVLTNSETFRLSLTPVDRTISEGEAIGMIEPLGAKTQTPSPGDREESVDCVVAFAHGLHARPAARIAEASKRHSGEVTIIAGGKSANARSPVAIMALNVNHGDCVTVTASGEDSDAALRDVAAVLAAGEAETSVESLSTDQSLLDENELAGLCAVPGAAVGTAVRWRREAVKVPEQGQGADLERRALDDALSKVAAELRAAAATFEGAGGEIATAHVGLVEDENLRVAAAGEIDAGKSAAFAWTSATTAAAEALGATDNPRMRERIADLRDVGAQVVRAIIGKDAVGQQWLPDGAILLAEDLLPSELLSIDRKRLAGMAIERGGATSHMAIIAGSLGVPTIVAIGPRLTRVSEGARVLLDATAGRLVLEPEPERIAHATDKAAAISARTGECATKDGQHVVLLANLGGVGEVEAAVAAGAEGCGLLRTEFLFLDRSKAPTVAEQTRAYQAVADALGGRPLTIRTLDIGGDKPVAFIKFGHEENPALGARGVRTSLIHPQLIDDQLSAIAQVRSDALKVMLPMVSSVAELRQVRERFAQITAGQRIKLGAMIETPAAALIAERLAEEADFLSIGTNDLAQYALAMDRTNALLAPFIEALHPAVLRLIAMTAEAGARAGITVSVCGNLASDPIGALLLIGYGIYELSGVPAALPMVRHSIGQVTVDQCRELAARAVEMESAAQVRALAAELLNEGA
jgi:phosphoenolpyruvate-protein phosphotransferase